MSTQTIADVVVRTKIKERTVKKYKVLYHNDDKTTMDFVIQSLRKHFDKNFLEAVELTMKIHNDGKGIAGIYPLDVAEHKATEAIEEARNAGFPLRITWEEA